jgi:hypothetical protein
MSSNCVPSFWERCPAAEGSLKAWFSQASSSLVEITTRTIQGRLLLRPSPELTDIILGVIGKAQNLYEMTIHTFVVVSTRWPAK